MHIMDGGGKAIICRKNYCLAIIRNDVLEVQLYYRSDFKLHVKRESLIADHCITFALSDPTDPAFRMLETHQHEEQCPRCSHTFRTFRFPLKVKVKWILLSILSELLKLISDSVDTAPSDNVKKQLMEMHFKVKSHREIIDRLRNHEVIVLWNHNSN